ncbi:hypothetical protein PAMC26510_08310 [Caballeronia sordidicola]|uniref:Methyltransferase domain-containing protein n=2 Tax=Burkholderiales TaxID=80840 RepID=A0A242N1W5_CABSO|nr:hypothetical protein PAMC26510_08310 [Caballeronia sordidicola]
MQGFENSLVELVSQVNPQSIHEVGCGEGYWVMRWADQGITSTGSDFSEKVIQLARANALDRGLDARELWSKVVFAVRQGFEGGGGLAENVACLE